MRSPAARGPLGPYLASFEFLEQRLGLRRGWAHGLRQAALERFVALGFPTTKSEEWRYTSLAPLVETPFALAGSEGAIAGSPDRDLDGIRLQFLNGHLDPGASVRAELPVGVTVESLAEMFLHWSEVLAPYLGRYASFQDHALTALNTAFLEDGAFVRVPHGVEMQRPIVLHYASAPSRQGPTVSHPRTLIVVDPGSRAVVVELYTGTGHYFTNAVTEVVLGEEASVDHYVLRAEGEAAWHIARVQVEQGPRSRFISHAVTLGGALSRGEFHVHLGAEGAKCVLDGLYVASGQQHVDSFTRIDHASPRCTSRELYKGVLDGRATGVFSGQVLVRLNAQKTDATQINKNLLLSDDAVVDTRPQLAIYADDVKCTHGAAVGQLDPAMVFYLRSRGVPSELARALLTRAFANEMVERIRFEPWRERIQTKVDAALPGSGNGRRVA